MTEALTLNPGNGGAQIVVDALTTLNGAAVPENNPAPTGPVVQRMKVGFGPDGALRDVDADNPLPIAGAVTISGVATASKQDTGNSTLGAILAALQSTLGIGGAVTVSNLPATQPVSGPLTNAELRASAVPVSGTVDVSGSVAVTGTFWQATQPISAASLPLPTGAATAALQTTGNATLTSILTALGSPLQAGGSVSIAGTVPVSAASLPLPSGAATSAKQDAIIAALGSPLQAGGSVSITGTVAVSAASLPLPTGAATAANQATGNTSLANLDTDVGAIDAAPAAADGTGNYSLVAAAKRALLNWANLLARLPAALGQTTMAGSLSVALASDQSRLNVSPDNVLDNLTTSGSVTSAATVVSASTAGFNGGSFQVTSAGTSCTVTYEHSDDGNIWVLLAVRDASTSTNNPTQTSTATGIFQFTSSAAFVRARVSTYSIGTVAITLVQKRNAAPVSGVSLAQSGATIGNVGLNGGGNTIGNLTRVLPYTDSSTALGSAGVFTGTGRVTTGANYPWFRARALADQAGTLFIECSTDSGTTYRVAATVAVAAGVPAEIVTGATGAAGTATLYRVRYVNGGTAQGAFQLSSMFHA